MTPAHRDIPSSFFSGEGRDPQGSPGLRVQGEAVEELVAELLWRQVLMVTLQTSALALNHFLPFWVPPFLPCLLPLKVATKSVTRGGETGQVT